jgi:hypothetical protein
LIPAAARIRSDAFSASIERQIRGDRPPAGAGADDDVVEDALAR